MTGEWQFLLYREDAYTNALLALRGGVAGQNERGFREVHLFGERLHLGVGESSAVGEYGQRITLERTRREHVPLRHCQTPRCWVQGSSPGRIDGTRPKLGAALRRRPVN